MTSSKSSPRPVPPPQGVQRAPNAYARFIPREELDGFAAWTPDVFAGLQSLADRLAQQAGEAAAAAPATAAAAASAPAEPEPPVAPPAPTAEEIAAQLAEARQQGWQDGYRDGLEALEAAKRQFAQQVSAQVGQVVASLEQQLAELEAQMAQALVETSVTLARQVVRSELQQRPECIQQVAREAVEAVMLSARHLRLRLNPADQALVADGAAELLQGREVQLLADPAIQPGGCVVDSDLGRVDAQIETRWAQAAAVFNVALPWASTAESAPEAEPAAGGEGA